MGLPAIDDSCTISAVRVVPLSTYSEIIIVVVIHFPDRDSKA